MNQELSRFLPVITTVDSIILSQGEAKYHLNLKSPGHLRFLAFQSSSLVSSSNSHWLFVLIFFLFNWPL